MRAFRNLIVAAVATSALMLGGCGGSGKGVSTASVLDGAATGAPAGVAGVKADDPAARPTQVAWTAARAQRCGFAFDAAKLKANFLANEAAKGTPAPALSNTEKVYDQSFASNAARIKAEPDYCSQRANADIKTDLQRVLAGNYDPDPAKQAPKKVAVTSFLDGLKSDEPPEAFDQKNFWNDLQAKKDGAKGAQRTE